MARRRPRTGITAIGFWVPMAAMGFHCVLSCFNSGMGVLLLGPIFGPVPRHRRSSILLVASSRRPGRIRHRRPSCAAWCAAFSAIGGGLPGSPSRCPRRSKHPGRRRIRSGAGRWHEAGLGGHLWVLPAAGRHGPISCRDSAVPSAGRSGRPTDRHHEQRHPRDLVADPAAAGLGRVGGPAAGSAALWRDRVRGSGRRSMLPARPVAEGSVIGASASRTPSASTPCGNKSWPWPSWKMSTSAARA